MKYIYVAKSMGINFFKATDNIDTYNTNTPCLTKL